MLFFTIFQKWPITPYLILRVRRECIIDDNLRQVSNNEIDLKKRLKIEFIGENGIDIDGLRKKCIILDKSIMINILEMFTWSEKVNYYWFNPTSFESLVQYYLVGVILGLAIYNSTILDVYFPLACYKKLLDILYELDDLKNFRPGLIEGFQYLLAFDDNVEDIFCRDFVGEYEAL
ncbi:hypothetical protein PNEG_00555 [Pneumocystis murina B123]|uniref:HECT-type E3 ubiquitin transferase n=1 Tax=Pneumocystis murina (strain B123) TaxID=1069680 RepID=M7NW66_PNEMU|nr:hypothetical protein PNEG_00555 [Pneumocystis murina B123]EMR11547.1 hypothetical protein PNEG_00555 [Pneumocystis murina B123]